MYKLGCIYVYKDTFYSRESVFVCVFFFHCCIDKNTQLDVGRWPNVYYKYVKGYYCILLCTTFVFCYACTVYVSLCMEYV